ncbi:hypothetical protein ACFL5U_03920, partial [Candidatus Margulisiibacteriota bacterium]
MKLSQLGEFGLIDKIASLIGKPSGDVVVGIGDDCAVIELPTSNLKLQNKSKQTTSNPQTYLLITTDTLVEGVHFRSKTSYYHLG